MTDYEALHQVHRDALAIQDRYWELLGLPRPYTAPCPLPRCPFLDKYHPTTKGTAHD